MTAPARTGHDTPALVAARWFARRRRGLSAAEAAELAVWLEADPDHRRAWRNLQVAWRDVEAMRDDPAIMTMRAEAKRGFGPSRRLVGGMAAALAVLIAGSAAMLGVHSWSGGRFSDQAYRTDVGQRATVTLPDGSVVTLNTDTVLRTRAAQGRRLVYLDRGQAFFKVAKDRAHPFVVTAAGRTITALGTAFDVRVDEGQTFKVTLVEGKVRVEAPPPAPPPAKASEDAEPVSAPEPPVQAIEMTAGAQLRASADEGGRWNLTRVDVGRETSWTNGQLVFYAEPLSSVVAELNRYSDRKIVIDGGAYAARPISGTFKVGDVETFVRGLERYRMARVEADTSSEIHLTAP